MRILVTTSEWPSPERSYAVPFIVRQVELIRELGVDVDVFAFRGKTNPLRYLRARSEVARKLREARYDLVHAHFGQAGLVVPRNAPPLVATFWGDDILGVWTPRGYTLRGRLLAHLSKRVARRARFCITCSDVIGRELPAGTLWESVRVAVDLEVFRPLDRAATRRELGLPLDRRLVMFGGEVSEPRKRLPLAREAVALVPPPGAQLVTVVGQPLPVVAKYMAACDALICTSAHEGGPLMVKEALACNTPVIATDVGDVRQTIGDIPGCAVITDTDPAAIARLVDEVLSFSEPFEGRAAVYGLDVHTAARRVVDIYERVLSAASTRR